MSTSMEDLERSGGFEARINNLLRRVAELERLAGKESPWVTTFVPQLDQGASTNIAKTPNYCEWRYDGPMIDFQCYLTLTAGGTAGSAFTMTLPVTPFIADRALGICMLYRAVFVRVADVMLLNTNKAAFWETNSGGNVTGIDPNVAMASGDQINAKLRYRWR